MNTGIDRKRVRDNAPHIILGGTPSPDANGSSRQALTRVGRAVLALALIGGLGYAARLMYHESTGRLATHSMDQGPVE